MIEFVLGLAVGTCVVMGCWLEARGASRDGWEVEADMWRDRYVAMLEAEIAQLEGKKVAP